MLKVVIKNARARSLVMKLPHSPEGTSRSMNPRQLASRLSVTSTRTTLPTSWFASLLTRTVFNYPKLWRILGNMVDKECFQIEFQFQEQKIPETLGHGRCDFRTNGSRCAPGPSNHPMHPPMWSTVPWRPRRSRSSWLWRPFASCF